MRDNDLYFIRWTYKHDGTVWKQLYNEEPVQVDETWKEYVRMTATDTGYRG